jgi:hypothetical protein
MDNASICSNTYRQLLADSGCDKNKKKVAFKDKKLKI